MSTMGPGITSSPSPSINLWEDKVREWDSGGPGYVGLGVVRSPLHALPAGSDMAEGHVPENWSRGRVHVSRVSAKQLWNQPVCFAPRGLWAAALRNEPVGLVSIPESGKLSAKCHAG